MKARVARVVFIVAFAVSVASAASAQATRTWVSGVGDDANPCSRTAPCKTFAGAISKTADGGFINVLDPGGYGALTIVKNITVDGGGMHAGVLAAGTYGFTINAPNIKVVLRNLSIESPTVPLANRGINGIRVLQAGEVHIENVVIIGFSQAGIDFNPSGGGEGYISDTTLIDNNGGGVLIKAGRLTADRVRAESNANGGILVAGNAIATVRNSVSVGNVVGFGAVANASGVMNVEGCTASHNTNGIFAANGATVRVSNSLITGNITNGLLNSASTIISLQGNSVVGNTTDGTFSSTIVKQ